MVCYLTAEGWLSIEGWFKVGLVVEQRSNMNEGGRSGNERHCAGAPQTLGVSFTAYSDVHILRRNSTSGDV